MGEWENARIGDFFDLVTGFAFKSKEFQDSGVPVIKIKNVKAREFSKHEFSYVDAKYLAERANKVAQKNDLLISMSGNRHDGSPETWVGKVCRFDESTPYLINQRVGALRLKKDRPADIRFFGFLLSGMPYQETFIAIATSSGGQANLSPTQILGAPVRYPDLMNQQRIGDLLGALGDKIELNRRMNETLEAMARAVFKDWFVDFGPTRAKVEGRAAYLASELWNLFPDALDDEQKPVGWRLSEIGKEVKVVGGTTPSTKEPSFWTEGEHHWATPKDLSKLGSPVLLDTDRKITNAGLTKISSGLLPIGTVLLSSRAPIGYLAVAEVPTAVNQGFIAMVCKKQLSNLFVLFWCYENLDYIKSISGGSTFAEISKRVFRPVPAVVPSEQVLTAYDRIVRPLYDGIAANTRESVSLAETRDLLLPKLMSGEIRLAEATVDAP